ncbi:MAG: hypothetical protein O7H41_13935 [Planctomycetota bacterium]|nr:hypothetical protein [Planctomycetota bacterium]
MAWLEALVRGCGPPLVLKSDNEAVFRSQEMKKFLVRWAITPLLSPLRTPRYNGSCQAGIGSMGYKDLNIWLSVWRRGMGSARGAIVLLGAVLFCSSILPPTAGGQGKEERDGPAKEIWEEPYGRFSVTLGDRWRKRWGGGPAPPGWIFGNIVPPEEYSEIRKLRISLFILVRETKRSGIQALKDVIKQDYKTLEGRAVDFLEKAPEVVTVAGRESRKLMMKKPTPMGDVHESRFEEVHFLVPGRDYVVVLKFLYDEAEAEYAGPRIEEFLSGVELPTTPPSSIRVARRKAGHQRLSPLGFEKVSAARPPWKDPLGLIQIRDVPEGWALLRNSNGSLLQGLALEKLDAAVRIYLRPLPMPIGDKAPDAVPKGAVVEAFPVLEDLPERELPDIDGIMENSGGTYRGKLQEGHGTVWWFLLLRSNVRVLVVMTWTDPGLSEPGEIIRGIIELVRAGVPDEAWPAGTQGKWVDHLMYINPQQARTSNQVYTVVWKFETDGAFRRESYAGNPPRIVQEETGNGWFLENRYLFLVYSDESLEVLPMIIDQSIPTSVEVDLDGRTLYRFKSKRQLVPWH